MSADDVVSFTARVLVGNNDITNDVVFSQTQFSANASAQPGNCSITVRNPDKYTFTPGDVIAFFLNGEYAWQGFAFTLERGYMLEDRKEPKLIIGGVDLNILFDKLIVYNHARPQNPPDGNGAYAVGKFTLPDGTKNQQPYVPPWTTDVDYIRNMLNDTDIYSSSVRVKIRLDLTEVDYLATTSDPFTTPDAGITLRALMQDVAGSVKRQLPGSAIWYISPNGYLTYGPQDKDRSPVTIGDGTADLQVRGLSHMTDISSIKNDVLIYAGNLNPDPESKQAQFLYRHNSLTASIQKYGQFQYSEVLQAWSRARLQARSAKILFQQGTPAERLTFSCFYPGFYPGQIVRVISPTLGIDSDFPIRQISTSFLTPTTARFDIICSFDTNDPFGMLLALKRPATRGLVRPYFQTVRQPTSGDWTDEDNPPTVQPLTVLNESWPNGTLTSQSGNKFKTTYPYVRNSMSVYVGPLAAMKRMFNQTNSVTSTSVNSVGYIETDPDRGIFTLGSSVLKTGDAVHVVYHASDNFTTG